MGKVLYILYSKSRDRYYVGSTKNLDRRLSEHNSGQTISTRSGKPWEKVFSHEFYNSQSGLKAERRIKKLKSRKIIKEIISGRIDIEDLIIS